jgi:signal peptidase I
MTPAPIGLAPVPEKTAEARTPAAGAEPLSAPAPQGRSHLFRRTKPAGAPHLPVNTKREALETIVFVVVLVLLLKTFAAEAFVIPTGSMATTLLGYNKHVNCPQCGYSLVVNCSDEVEQKRGGKVTNRCRCSNCFHEFDFDASPSSGDRVLVAKFLSDLGLKPLHRGDVVVFKFPEEPVEDHVPKNYIKRLIGLSDEVVGILRGKILLSTREKLKEKGVPFTLAEWKKDRAKYQDLLNDAETLPLRRQMLLNHKDIKDLLEARDPVFEMYRKPPEKMLALRRPVFDNDFQPKDLTDKKYARRWAAEGEGAEGGDYVKLREEAENDPFTWKADEENKTFKVSGRKDKQTSWLRYRNVTRNTTSSDSEGKGKPELITDFMTYNTDRNSHLNWVGDLMLECEVKIDKAEGELILELCKGYDRFQARFQLDTGKCTLFRGDQELGSAATAANKTGTYHLRFANVDERLTLWVDNALPFGDGKPYAQPEHYGPKKENDLEPASIGTRGAASLSVRHLKLWRDTYYTVTWAGTRNGDAEPTGKPTDPQSEYWSDPGQWENEDNAKGMTMYVQPNHFLCLGDNSAASSDSRIWDKGTQTGPGGLVPENMMLGRALMVYWPVYRAGRIR